MIDKFPFAKKASGKHKGMQKRAKISSRDNRTKDVLSSVDKRENAVDRGHIRIIHTFILLVVFALIHTEFPCACTDKNVNTLDQYAY